MTHASSLEISPILNDDRAKMSLAVELVCQYCQDEVFNRKSMAVLFEENTVAKREGQRDHKHGRRVTFYTNRAQIEAGLAKFCAFCTLQERQRQELLQTTSYMDPDMMENLKEAWEIGHERQIWFEFQKAPPFGMDRIYVAAKGIWGNIGYHPYTKADDPGATWIPYRNVETDYTSVETIKAMNNWVYWCADIHEECRVTRQLSMPTRVLELLDGGTLVKLSSMNDRQVSYVALSYTWGGNIDFVTTDSTLQSRSEPFAASELPQTIQDAVWVTHQLKLKYLWVDSLCIIQDSDNDKANQVSRMDSIYQNAFVTVSATNAVSAYSGFLHHVFVDETCYRLPFFYPDGSEGTVFVGDDPWYHGEPLHRRAWTFQERILSGRLLEFTSFGIRAACPVGEYALAQKKGVNHGPIGFPEHVRKVILSGNSEPSLITEEVLKAWDTVLTEYTERQLTNYEDKLPALSGLASRFLQHLNCRYMAGLWDKHLQLCLMWHGKYTFRQMRFRKELVPLKRIPQTRSPSWSWASTEGPINSTIAESYRQADCHITMTIKVGIVELKDGRVPFGQVLRGALQVDGFFKECTCLPSDLGRDKLEIGPTHVVDITPDDPDEWSLALQGATIFLVEIEREKRDNDNTEAKKKKKKKKSFTFWSKPDPPPPPSWRSCGLILCQDPTAGGISSRRLGYFQEMEPKQEDHLFKACERKSFIIV